jgi:NitT/TauT family transport system permease protein
MPRRNHRRFNGRGLAFAVGLTVLLEILVRTGTLPDYLPPPSTIAAALVDGLGSGEIASEIGTTVGVFVEGLALAALIGVAAGVATALWPRLDGATRLLVELGRPVPAVALIPLAILLLGLGEPMRLAVVAYAAVWPILFNTYYGVRGVDALSLDTARNFGLGRARTIRTVVLPSALPGIATGVRISAAIALILTVTAELVAGTDGIGYYIATAEQAGRIPQLYAGILLTGLLGYLVNRLLVLVERRTLFWDAAFRHQEQS